MMATIYLRKGSDHYRRYSAYEVRAALTAAGYSAGMGSDLTGDLLLVSPAGWPRTLRDLGKRDVDILDAATQKLVCSPITRSEVPW